MNFFIKTLIHHYADFGGRASRTELFLFLFWIFLISTLVSFFAHLLIPQAANVIFALLFLFFLIPGLAVQVRRMHDINASGWLIILGILPIICLVYLFMLFLPPVNENNAYNTTTPKDDDEDIDNEENGQTDSLIERK